MKMIKIKLALLFVLLLNVDVFAASKTKLPEKKETDYKIKSIFDAKELTIEFGCCLPKHSEDFPFRDVLVGSWF